MPRMAKFAISERQQEVLQSMAGSRSCPLPAGVGPPGRDHPAGVFGPAERGHRRASGLRASRRRHLASPLAEGLPAVGGDRVHREAAGLAGGDRAGARRLAAGGLRRQVHRRADRVDSRGGLRAAREIGSSRDALDIAGTDRRGAPTRHRPLDLCPPSRTLIKRRPNSSRTKAATG